MNKIRRGSMGLGLCMIAGALLFHPIVAGIDVLPDIIGYLLLFVGMSKFADLNGHVAEARRHLRAMLFVGAGQLIATYIVYGMIERMMQERPSEMSTYEGPMLTLLFSFVLLVLRSFFLIPAWKELFLGLDTLAERFDATSLTSERRGRTSCGRMAKHSTVFVIISSLLSFLPEASVLTSYEAHKGNPLFPFDWYVYVNLFRAVAGVASFVIGLIWLIAYLRCLNSFRRDPVFSDRAAEAYETTVLPQTGMLTVRRFSAAFLLFTVGSVFAVSFRINYYALTPGIVFAGFCLAGIALLQKYLPKKQNGIAAAILLAVVSGAELIANRFYLQNHLPEASLYETDAYWRFLTVRVLDAAEAVATLILVGALMGMLHDLVLNYTAVDYGTRGSETLSYDATERQHQSYQKRMIVLLTIFAISAVASVADAVFRLQIGWIWVIALVLSIVGVWNLRSLMQDLLEQIGGFYHSDGVNKNV